jgi:hypothetical protein
MVNIGDTVQVTFAARDSFTDFRVYYDPFSELSGRLAAAGFRVVSIDGPRGAFGGLTYDNYRVVVIPLTSAYASEQDIAGIVAGAAEQIGLQVDNVNAVGTVIARGAGNVGPATTNDYLGNVTDDRERNQTGWLSDIAGAVGVSEGTLGFLLAAGLIVGVLVFVKK